MKSGVVRSGVGLGGDQRVTNRYHELACRGNLPRMPRSRRAFGGDGTEMTTRVGECPPRF
jgi:hypothetical protein